MPFFQSRHDDDEFVRSPASCRCTNYDYSAVEDGKIVCRECGRVWRMRGRGWWPYPCPGCNRDPEHCPHYGGRPRKKKPEESEE